MAGEFLIAAGARLAGTVLRGVREGQQKRLEIAPEILLKVQVQHFDEVWRLVWIMISNSLDERLTITEINIPFEIGTWGFRVAASKWDGNDLTVPALGERRTGRTLTMNEEIKPCRAEIKWRTRVPIFFRHPTSREDERQRLPLVLRVERAAPRKMSWTYKFDARVPAAGDNVVFPPLKIAT